jgi:hypothetical protein
MKISIVSAFIKASIVMKFFLNLGDILGAVVSSKMTGDLRAHAGWILKLLFLFLVLSYLAVRP